MKNLSSKKLFISEVLSACFSVVGTLQDSTVFPKQSVSLKVIFMPKPFDTGEVIRFVSVRNDRSPPIKFVDLKRKVN